MVTIFVSLENDVNQALNKLCAGRGLDKADFVADLIRKHIELEQLKRTMQDPGLAKIHKELASEDVALAEEGMHEYRDMLNEADQP